MPKENSRSSTQSNAKTSNPTKKSPRTIAEHIAVIDRISERHLQQVSVTDVQATSSMRGAWLKAVVKLSDARPSCKAEAIAKTKYLGELCEVCLLPLALHGIVANETFSVMRSLEVDARAWGLPVQGHTRH